MLIGNGVRVETLLFSPPSPFRDTTTARLHGGPLPRLNIFLIERESRQRRDEVQNSTIAWHFGERDDEGC